jgi:spermidine/putrescine transport system substrate-binding protein
MDFVYQPKVAADLTKYITYVSPVDGVQDVIAKQDPTLAKDQLVFPSAEFQRNCSTQDSPPDVDPVNEAWQAVITG